MDWILIAVGGYFAVFFLGVPLANIYSATKEWASGIAAPVFSDTDIPRFLASTVPGIEDICPVSDFTSTLWVCPSATATTTATATATATATSTPVFSPSDIPEHASVWALAPGLPDADSLGIATFAILVVALIFYYAYHLWQVKDVQHPVDPPEESLLSCWDEVVNGTFYIDQEALAIFQWQESENLRSQITANKLETDARESDLKKKIAEEKRKSDERVKSLEAELTVRKRDYEKKIDDLKSASDARESEIQAQIADRERSHKADIANRERTYRDQIAAINAKHKRALDDATNDANNQRRRLHRRQDEIFELNEARDKLEAQLDAGMLAPVPSEPMAAPVEAESLTGETEEVSPTKTPSRATTPEQDSAEPTAEALPEAEPRISGVALPEPSLMGEGVAQTPQDQEKGYAQDAPVPTEGQAASLQLTEPEAAPGPLTSEDGASKAPVATEVEPEVPTGDRETEEPGAVEESAGPLTSEDGASEAPVATEVEPEVPTGDRETEEPGAVEESAGPFTSEDGASDAPVAMEVEPEVQTGDRETEEPGAVEGITASEESADDMDEGEDSSITEATLERYSAPANGSERMDEAGASEGLTSPPAFKAGVIDCDDKMADALPDEAPSEDCMDEDGGDNAADDSETMSSAQPGEEWLSSHMDEDGSGDATNATGSQTSDMGDTEMAEPETAQSTWRKPYSDNIPLLQVLYPDSQRGQPASNGSGASSGPIKWNFSRDPTFKPPAQTDRPLTDAQKMNVFARQVNGLIWGWINKPEHAGISAAILQQGRNDPTSIVSLIILDAASWARHVTTELRNELKKSPLSAEADAEFRLLVPAMRMMRYQYGLISHRKGCPNLFADVQAHIDSILSVLVPALPPPPAQVQQPAQVQRPRVKNNPLLGDALKDEPLKVAKKILDWVEDGRSKCSKWELPLEAGGTDASSLQKMSNDSISPLWGIVVNMSRAADYLEHEGRELARKRPTDSLYLTRVLPAAQSMREKYEDLGRLKKCPQFFVNLLNILDRVLKQLKELEQESPTPPAQLPAQSTQTAGTEQPQQPNPLVNIGPMKAAFKIKEWVQDIEETYLVWEPNHEMDMQGNITKRGTDGNDFVQMHNDPASRFSEIMKQIGWAADYLEQERRESDTRAEATLREQVKPLVEDTLAGTNYLATAKGSAHIFQSLLRDFSRILKELENIS